jgi:hypothetical protein
MKQIMATHADSDRILKPLAKLFLLDRCWIKYTRVLCYSLNYFLILFTDMQFQAELHSLFSYCIDLCGQNQTQQAFITAVKVIFRGVPKQAIKASDGMKVYFHAFLT